MTGVQTCALPICVGTNQKFYVELYGVYHDITPLAYTVTLPNPPFATTLGSYAVVVTFSAPHNLSLGTYVTFSGVPVPGTVNGVQLNGNFEVIALPSSTTATIRAGGVATSTGTGGGAAVSAAVELNAGNAVFSLGLEIGRAHV